MKKIAPKGTPKRPTQDKLTKLLQKKPHLTIKELASALDITHQRVRVVAKAQKWEMVTNTTWQQRP